MSKPHYRDDRYGDDQRRHGRDSQRSEPEQWKGRSEYGRPDERSYREQQMHYGPMQTQAPRGGAKYRDGSFFSSGSSTMRDSLPASATAVARSPLGGQR